MSNLESVTLKSWSGKKTRTWKVFSKTTKASITFWGATDLSSKLWINIAATNADGHYKKPQEPASSTRWDKHRSTGRTQNTPPPNILRERRHLTYFPSTDCWDLDNRLRYHHQEPTKQSTYPATTTHRHDDTNQRLTTTYERPGEVTVLYLMCSVQGTQRPSLD